MKKSKDILNKAINSLKNESVPPGPPQETIDATLAKLTEAAGEPDTVTAEKRVKVIESIRAAKRFTRIAATAVVIIAALIGIKIFTGPTKEPEEKVVKQQDVTATESVVEAAKDKDDEPPLDTTRRSELEKIEQMFAAGDIDGLVAMLSAEQSSSRLIATIYLAKIGDLRAVETLEKLSAEHRGDESGYLFALAASMIKSRLEQEKQKAQPTKAGDEESGVAPTAKESLPKPKDTITYSGIATNKNGEPIEGVEVRSELRRRSLYAWWTSLEKTEAKVKTDSKGWFEIGPLPAIEDERIRRKLVFEHPDYATAWWSGSWGNNLKIALSKPIVVAGVVMDQDGNAIEGATVSANLQDAGPYERMDKDCNIIAQTDAEGRFVIDKIAEGARLHIDVLKKGFVRYTTRDYARNSYPIRAAEEDLLITLKPGGVIRGRLISEGKPYRKAGIVVGAKVTGSAVKGQAITEENGHFEIGGLDINRLLTLTVDHENLAGTDLICKPLENVEVRDGKESIVELELQKGLPVMVRIIDEETNEAVSGYGFSIVLSGPDARPLRNATNVRIASGRTDNKGQCAVMLTPDYYRLYAYTWQGGREYQVSQDFSVKADSNDLSIELAITPRPMIHGWLVDAEGEPVRGHLWFARRHIRTDEQGAFEVLEPRGGLDETFYTCYAFDAENKLGRGFFWQRSEGANDLEIVLHPLASIAGRIVDANGEGLGGVEPQIGILGSDGRWRTEKLRLWKTTVEADGWFRIEDVPIGLPMVVSVTQPGRPPDVKLGELTPGEVVGVNDIIVKDEVLQELHEFKAADIEWDGALSGQVTDENGEPMVDFRISVRFGPKTFTDFTDIKGRYQFSGLPKGKNVKLVADGQVDTKRYSNSFDVVCDGNDFDVQLLPKEQK